MTIDELIEKKKIPTHFGLGRALERLFLRRTRMLYHDVCKKEMLVDQRFIEDVYDYAVNYAGCAFCRFYAEPPRFFEKPTKENAVIYDVRLKWAPRWNPFRWRVIRSEVPK